MTDTEKFPLKRLSPAGIDAALRKAERYRLLNEPAEAESICRDVLDVDPGNEAALVMLLLALTDEFGAHDGGAQVSEARALLARLPGEYGRAYYAGIICERWAKRLLDRSQPGSGPMIYDWLREAMEHYETAESLRAAGDDTAILRWNSCARLIMKHGHIRPAPAEALAEMPLE